jgi:uncharacterized membrane protein YeaQ/YmgE (transglycosylase-associated protein family)
MTVLELIVYLVIAALCGGVARALGGGTPGGFIVSVLLGFLGAFVGTSLARLLRLPEFFAVTIDGHKFPIVWSIVGGVILVALAHLLVPPPLARRWHARH